ncbi:MAG: hypothetical protein ABI832_04745 [bacterium]
MIYRFEMLDPLRSLIDYAEENGMGIEQAALYRMLESASKEAPMPIPSTPANLTSPPQNCRKATAVE